MVTHVLGITWKRLFGEGGRLCGLLYNCAHVSHMWCHIEFPVESVFILCTGLHGAWILSFSADVMAAKITASNTHFLAGFLPRLPGYHWSLIVSSKGHRVWKEYQNPPGLIGQALYEWIGTKGLFMHNFLSSSLSLFPSPPLCKLMTLWHRGF